MGHRPKPSALRMMADDRINEPLGRIAEILLGQNASVSLNETWSLLRALDARAYAAGYRDGQKGVDHEFREIGELEWDPRSGSRKWGEQGP